VPPEGEEPPTRLDERVEAEKERFERAAEPLAEKPEAVQEEPEPGAVREPAGTPQPKAEGPPEPGAAPPAPPPGPPAADGKAAGPETPAKEKEAEALQKQAAAAEAAMQREAPQEPQSAEDVRALIAEGEPEAAGTAEPPAPAAGPAAELEQWKARAGAAAGNIPEPDLGPAEARTQGVSEFVEEAADTQNQRREELPKERQEVIKARKRDISELDQVPEALTKDDPANAVEGIKKAAQREGLPRQFLPNLQPTPKGYLPNLYGDPITPSQLAELREQYKDKLLPKDRQPPGYDEIAALKKALADDEELEGRIAVFSGQEVSGFELPPKLEISPIHQEDIAAVLARIVTEAEGLGKSWIEDARKTAYKDMAMIKPDAFPDLGNEWAPQEAEFLLGEMQRVADAAGIAKQQLDQAIRDRQQQLAGDTTATQKKGEEVFKDNRSKLVADFQNTQGAIEGLRREWEDWADARAASIKGNVDWKAIRARQGELEKAVCDMANEWVVTYDDMNKQRTSQLLQAMAGQKQAYEKAIAKDKEEDLLAAGEDEAKRKEVEASKAYADWVKARMEPIKEQIQGKKGYISANTETVQKWQTKMREVRDGAVERLKQWADRQINRERGWIEWIMSTAGEWQTGQRSEAEAFARQRTRDTTAALGNNLQQLNNFKTKFGETLGKDGEAKRAELSAEQQAVIDTYYKGGGDAIGAVATGLKLRLRGQRLPELQKALREKVLATPTNDPDGMRLVGLVKGMGEPDPAGIAFACRSGFEHTWGTDEDKIFNALAKIRSKEGGKAVRAAYWNRYPPPEDFDTRLRDELAGGGLDDEEEYDKAKAQLELNKIDVAAADLRIAVEKWGTNEEKINEVLRGLDDEDRKKVIGAYKTKYRESLKTRLDSELSGYEKDITFALFDGNKDKADAIELKQAQDPLWGPDKEQMEKVYQRISDEEWERGRSKELPAAEIEKNIKARKAKLGEEYKEKFKTTVNEDFKKTFQLMDQPVYADLMIGLQESKWTEVDAARLEIERNPAYSVYAEDKTINEKVLKAQYDRAYKNRLYDAELALQKEERTWTEANPDKPWNPDDRRKRQQDLAKKASEAAQADSQQSMNALRTYYMKEYRGGQAPEGFDEIIKDLTQGTGEEEAVDRLKSGGYLPPEKEIFYAVKGAGTDEDRLKATLKGKTKEEVQAIREAWNQASPKRTDFDEWILDELSGRDKFDVDMMLKYGEPTNPEDALALAKMKLDYEGRTGGIEQTEYGPVKNERYRDLELQTEQLEKDAHAYREARRLLGGPKTDEKTGYVYDHPQIAAYQNSWMSALTGFNDTVDIHRQEVDAKADLISGIVAMVVAVVVGALLAPFTAGQSLWLIAGAAALVAAASTAAAMAVKWSIKGDAYGGDELTMDLLFAGVDLIVSAATAGVGGKILKAGMQGGKTATEGAKKSFKQVIKEGWKRAGTKEAEKQFAHTALTETAQGMFSTVAVPSFMDEYGKGTNPLANMVLSMGLSMGSGIALAKGINGISRLRPADFDFEAAARTSGNKAALVEIRGNPEKLGAMRSAYLDANPHKTPKDFLKDYDDLLLKQMKDVEVKAKWQHEARADMLQYVPQEHKARFSETPIEMLSEQEFFKRTRSKKGEAFVEIKDGKPTVFVKQGASETALRREAPHLLQSVDEKWQGHLKDLDEGNLRNWNTKDTREKFRLYDRKLDVEIDSALRDLDLMRGQARTAVAMPSLQQEIEEVEETLRNLTKRRHEAGNIGPFRRTLMAWGGSIFEPQYLKQEPRLFSKTSTKRFTQRFRGRVAISTEAELRPDFYPQRSIARGLDLTSEKLHFQVHKASGGSGPSATLLRAVDPARPAGSPAPLVFVRKEKAIHFDLIDNRKLKLPPEPDGHFYRMGKSGEIELVPVGKHKGPFFELLDGAIQPRAKDANPIVLRPAETYSHSPRDWPVRQVTYDTLPRDAAGNIDVLPHGVVYEFPGGHRAWRLVNGGIAHESFVGVAHGRQHFELEFEAPGKAGRPGYHRAHSLGQGTGFESPFAIPYAPAKVNLAIQNDGIEEFLRGLRDQGPPGMRFHVVTETKFRPGSLDLDEITYRIEVSQGGRRSEFFEFDIKVSGPPRSPRITYGIPNVTADPNLEGLFHLVDVPERLQKRWERYAMKSGKAPTAPTAGPPPAAPPPTAAPAAKAPSKARQERVRKAEERLTEIFKEWGLSDEEAAAKLKDVKNPVAVARELEPVGLKGSPGPRASVGRERQMQAELSRAAPPSSPDANPVPAAKPATSALAGPGGGGAKPTVPLPGRPPTSDDPLVAVKIRGQNKGEYWPDGSPQFKANAGTAPSGPDPRYVVLPKSEAELVFRARPAGTKPDTAIVPRQRDGKLLESRGAGRTAAGREPKPGEQPKSPAHPISARTERKAVKGAPKGGDLEMAAPDPAAAHAFPRTIGADTKQAQGYNALLDSGELGLLRPGNISTGGVDAITVRIKDGKAEIFLNDFTTPGTAKQKKATHAKWHAELKNLMDSGRVHFDNKEIEDAIKRAFAENRVFVRPVRVVLPATAKPGPRPRAGLAEPALQLGKLIPFEK
jgi:hypothetical protein